MYELLLNYKFVQSHALSNGFTKKKTIIKLQLTSPNLFLATGKHPQICDIYKIKLKKVSKGRNLSETLKSL